MLYDTTTAARLTCCSLEKLSIKDIQLLCDYWNQNVEAPSQTPDHLADTDHLAVVTVVEGMRAYGCRLEELPTSSSRLVNLLREYVSLEALAKGNIQFLDKSKTQFCQWQPHKRRRVHCAPSRGLEATDRRLFTPETAGSDGAPLPGMAQSTDTQQELLIASETLSMVGDSAGNENRPLQLGNYMVFEEADSEWRQLWGMDPEGTIAAQ
ncbi:hypothetical protein P154DRAFT_10712 [Amniculicola lignicola CBS 123094]|uniref:Uncharacterized protein n=1 Tax=Amniculicola lignicola CBS 123094 TaxID=1392246 RepID=A0A6A5X4K6_9PLEO|nr:hypothetical protein P154DRAFT_10712 [Amniculicola lignicola CBS 123094]